MKSTVFAVPILAIAMATHTLAKLLPKGEECDNNTDCSKRCQDGTFGVTSDGILGIGDRPYFACSLEPYVLYNNVFCSVVRNVSAQNLNICKAAGGKYCSSSSNCIVPVDAIKSFEAECRKVNGTPLNIVQPAASYQVVINRVACKAPLQE